MEPTKEEIKRFWEWCEIKYVGDGRWLYPDGAIHWQGPPPLKDERTLGFLFKWAVPKLDKPQIAIRQSILPEHYEEWYCLLEYVIDSSSFRKLGYDKDPALALFRAINKVIEND